MTTSDRARWLALVATASSLLVVGLDTTILNVALPDIAVALGASGSDLQWFADSYLLALGALLLPAGLLGDRYGRKRFTLAGLAIFGVGSVWCAVASSTGSLIAARTLLGVGAAILIPLAMSSVVVLFEPAERGRAITVLGGATIIGLPLGPIVAGILLEHYWWGSVFLVTLPVIVLAFVAAVILLPETRSTSRALRIDWVGIALSSTALVALTVGVIEGPERGWTDVLVLTAGVGAVVLGVAFALWERTVSGVDPVVDLALWRMPDFRWGSITAMVASLAFFGVMFVLPLFLRGVLGADALGTGLRMLPLVIGLLVGLRLTVSLLPRLGAKVLGAGGFLVAAAGLVLGTRVAVGTPYAVTAIWSALAGGGVGAALFCGQNGALGRLPKERAASGSALVQTLRQVGSVTGIAVLGALLNGVYRGALDLSGVPVAVAEVVRQNVASGVEAAERLGSPALVSAVQAAFVDGMAATLWLSAGVAVVGAAIVWRFLPDARAVADPGIPAEVGPDAAESGHAVDVTDSR